MPVVVVRDYGKFAATSLRIVVSMHGSHLLQRIGICNEYSAYP